MGLSKRLARETLPQLVDFPGGTWVVGGMLGVITVAGAAGALRSAPPPVARRSTRFDRARRATLSALCCAAAFGPFLYLLSGLPSRNCRSLSCAYVPGTGPAFLSYAVTGGLVGWCVYRWSRGRAEERAAFERDRARRLRKKGKGKSRGARQR